MEVDPAWTQGSLIDPATLGDAGIMLGIRVDDIVVVISQSCDVIFKSFAAEPLLEVHIARPILALDGNNTHGKNPRILDFEEADASGEPIRYRCLDAERRRISRDILIGRTPSGLLDERNVEMLAKWTGRRFTRPAFPDEFNRRTHDVRTKVTRAVRSRGGPYLTAVFVALSDRRELPPNESYRIELLGAVPPSVRAQPGNFSDAARVVQEIAALLDAIPGINVDNDEVRSEDDISLTELRELLRLDFDYISIRDGDTVAPES